MKAQNLLFNLRYGSPLYPPFRWIMIACSTLRNDKVTAQKVLERIVFSKLTVYCSFAYCQTTFFYLILIWPGSNNHGLLYFSDIYLTRVRPLGAHHPKEYFISTKMKENEKLYQNYSVKKSAPNGIVKIMLF